MMKSHLHPRRLAAIAACAGAAAAFGASATTALAVTEAGTGVHASGSSLQTEAQKKWLTEWPKATGEFTPPSEGSIVEYAATSSGEGLEEFGNTGEKFVKTDSKFATGLDGFVGSDDAPSTTQITSANKASGSTEITLPVAQAPVAVLLSLPSGITGIKEDTGAKAPVTAWHLSNATLAALWSNEKITWNDLAADSGYEFVGTGGLAEVLRQGRSSSSGTTWTFRDYLYLLKKEYSLGTYEPGNVTDSPEGTPGTGGWPLKVNTSATQKGNEVNESTNAKGGELIKKTDETPGAVGYANTAEAVSDFSGTLTATAAGGTHLVAYALVQDNGNESAGVYASPVVNTDEANVDVTEEINTPGSGGLVGHWVDPTTADASWNPGTASEATYANAPDVFGGVEGAAEYYPIVAVTYDEAWSSYTTANLEEEANYGGTSSHAEKAEKVGNTVFVYLNYIIKSAFGLNNKSYYGEVPTAVRSSVNLHQLPSVNGAKK